MTGKPEVMPPGWQIAPDKRACIDWSGQLPGGRQPETNRLVLINAVTGQVPIMFGCSTNLFLALQSTQTLIAYNVPTVYSHLFSPEPCTPE